MLWKGKQIWPPGRHQDLRLGFVCRYCASLGLYPGRELILRAVSAVYPCLTAFWVPSLVVFRGQLSRVRYVSRRHRSQTVSHLSLDRRHSSNSRFGSFTRTSNCFFPPHFTKYHPETRVFVLLVPRPYLGQGEATCPRIKEISFTLALRRKRTFVPLGA